MKPPFYIYGSGDKGTAELCEIFTELQIEFLFRDIRTSDTNGDRVWLRYLTRQGHPTVPQVYYPNGVYLGDHDATLAYLQLHPDGWQQQAMVVA